jgi:hypothetical protein
MIMVEIKECVAKLLAENFAAYAHWDAACLDGGDAEDWGDFLAHVALVVARDEPLETDRDDGDRFAAIVDGFAASARTYRYWGGLIRPLSGKK